MTEQESEAPAPEPSDGKSNGRAFLRRLPRWKKVVITVAGFLLVSGLVLKGVGSLQGGGRVEDQRNLATERKAPGNSFFPEVTKIPPEGGGAEEMGPGATFQEYSPALLKGGFSFFVGFCVGYALRAFLKLSTIIAGGICLAIFGLSYAGWLQVDWAAMKQDFDSIFSGVKGQASNFQNFVTGSLPAAGMATLGLFTGVKKN